jgi:hypothetical protein
MKLEIMTLGEFRKYTEHLSDDIELYFNFGDDIKSINTMDICGDNGIQFISEIYDENPIMGKIRFASFLNKKTKIKQ